LPTRRTADVAAKITVSPRMSSIGANDGVIGSTDSCRNRLDCRFPIGVPNVPQTEVRSSPTDPAYALTLDSSVTFTSI
jgi:hypothetical protein